MVARILEKFVSQMNREALQKDSKGLVMPFTDWTVASCPLLVQKNGHHLRELLVGAVRSKCLEIDFWTSWTPTSRSFMLQTTRQHGTQTCRKTFLASTFVRIWRSSPFSHTIWCVNSKRRLDRTCKSGSRLRSRAFETRLLGNISRYHIYIYYSLQ